MATAPAEKQQRFPRFRKMAQLEHIILLVSFTTLAITGLPQKWPQAPFSLWMINLLGGIETVRIIHRWAAIILILGSFYHLFASGYRLFVKRERMRVLPVWKDALDLRDYVLYNLGFKSEHPKMPKFNFGEKFEYWAVVWGTAVMIITGFMLWNPIAVTNFLPGQFIPAAKAAHGGEAILAVTSILIWHIYNVVIKQFNPSMWTGWLPRRQMEEEHALELERLEAGGDPWPGAALEAPAHRKRNYFIVSAILGIFILAVIYYLFTFEETAITTLPAITPEVITPLVTPAP
ncbi:MAG: formate dehydrogenase subunit gamma [Candidatus Promineifilaceae bacterium]|jgi:formate dehydrogenase gamma subunit